MRPFCLSCLILLLLCQDAISSSTMFSDSSRQKISITYQPVLNFSKDQLFLQYIAFNAELSSARSAHSFDLQTIVTYGKLKTGTDFYRSIEHITLVETEIGRRFYFKSGGWTQKRGKTLKNHLQKSYQIERSSGAYFRPAIGLGLVYNIFDQIDLYENFHRTTKKLTAYPSVGLYIGNKFIFEKRNVVLNPFLGLKATFDTPNKVVYLSPLFSLGCGVQF
jgi:hypothetical protein